MPQPGELFRYPDYIFPDGGQKDKYVLLMGKTRGDDWILCRTTSQQHGRPQEPRCHHGNPYPSFFIDTAGGILPLPTWLALDRLDDHDADEFSKRVAAKRVESKGLIPQHLFCEALDCASRADDTTRAQENAMRDLRAELGCS